MLVGCSGEQVPWERSGVGEGTEKGKSGPLTGGRYDPVKSGIGRKQGGEEETQAALWL